MNRRIITLLAMGAAGAVAFSVPGFAGPAYNNKYPTTTEDPASTQNCGDGDLVIYNGPLKMWPPNHKLQNVSVTADAGNNADAVELTLTPASDEAVGGEGSGGKQHDPDWQQGNLIDTGTGSATVDFWLRAERSGKGDGRVYTIDWVAEFGEKTCSSTTSSTDNLKPFEVTVPHDMRGGAGWK